MCLDNGKKAAKEAAREERQRQGVTDAATGRINALFDSPERAAQQQDYLAALRERLTGQVNRQGAVAARNQKFALARNGLTGGSADVDAGRMLREQQTEGLIEAERRAQGGFSDLVGQDENARADLLSMAQSGLQTGAAASRAGAAMRNNLGRAQGAATDTWDAFSGVADVYRRQEEAAAKRQAQTAPVGSVWGTN